MEKKIFEELPGTLKDAFTLCKSLRKSPLTPDIIISHGYDDVIEDLDLPCLSETEITPISLVNTGAVDSRDAEPRRKYCRVGEQASIVENVKDIETVDADTDSFMSEISRVSYDSELSTPFFLKRTLMPTKGRA